MEVKCLHHRATYTPGVQQEPTKNVAIIDGNIHVPTADATTHPCAPSVCPRNYRDCSKEIWLQLFLAYGARVTKTPPTRTPIKDNQNSTRVPLAWWFCKALRYIHVLCTAHCSGTARREPSQLETKFSVPCSTTQRQTYGRLLRVSVCFEQREHSLPKVSCIPTVVQCQTPFR